MYNINTFLEKVLIWNNERFLTFLKPIYECATLLNKPKFLVIQVILIDICI